MSSVSRLFARQPGILRLKGMVPNHAGKNGWGKEEPMVQINFVRTIDFVQLYLPAVWLKEFDGVA